MSFEQASKRYRDSIELICGWLHVKIQLNKHTHTQPGLQGHLQWLNNDNSG